MKKGKTKRLISFVASVAIFSMNSLNAFAEVGTPVYDWEATIIGENCNDEIMYVDFEDFDPTQFAMEVTPEFTKDEAHTGEASLHLSGDPDEAKTVRFRSLDYIQANKSELYRAEVWVKAVNVKAANPENAYIYLRPTNGGNEDLAEDAIIREFTGDWQKLTVENIRLGNMQSLIRVFVGFGPGATGDLYIDDFRFVMTKRSDERTLELMPPEFDDVAKDFWAHDSIANLYNNGIVSGKSSTEFKPNDNLTREEFAKIAVLSAVETKSKKSGSFSDVPTGSWFSPYVETAAENNLIQGIGNGSFGAGQLVTRQDAAVIIDRILSYKGIGVTGTPISFKDSDSISDYAKNAIRRMSAAGYISGDENGSFNPLKAITRAEVCAIIDRLGIIENRFPDLVYRLYPEDVDKGEISCVEGFDSYESVADSETLNDKYTNEFGSTAPGCIVVSDSSECEIVLPKGIGTSSNLFFEVDVNSQINDTGKVNIQAVIYSADGTEVKKGAIGTVTGSTNGWRTVSFDFSSGGAFDYAKLYVSFEDVKYGDVYIDDAKMMSPTHSITATLLKPNYKGLIYSENTDGINDIMLDVWVKKEFMKVDIENALLSVKAFDKEGFAALSWEGDVVDGRSNVTLSSKNLDFGEYILEIGIVSKGNNEMLDSVKTILRKREGNINSLPEYIDENGLYHEFGKKKFVMGAFAPHYYADDPTAYDVLRDSAVDHTVHYWAGLNQQFDNDWLKKAKEAGVRIGSHAVHDINDGNYGLENLYECEQRTVDIATNLGKSDAIWGFYVGDEYHNYERRDWMIYRYQIINSLSDKPTYFVDARFKPWDTFCRTMVTDIFGEDNYTIKYNENDNSVGNQARYVKQAVANFKNRPIWHVLQVCNMDVMYGSGQGTWNAPSEKQETNMLMQVIANGGTGAFWWSLTHMDDNLNGETRETIVGNMRRACEVYKPYNDIIMSTENTPAVGVQGGDWLDWIVKRYNGKTYLFTGNHSITDQSAQFTVEGALRAKNLLTGEEYEVSKKGGFKVNYGNIDIAIIEIEQPEVLSNDAKVKNISFYNGDQSFLHYEENGKIYVNVPADVQSVSYEIWCNDAATVQLDGSETGKIGSFSGEEAQITIVSEDGKSRTTMDVVLNKK